MKRVFSIGLLAGVIAAAAAVAAAGLEPVADLRVRQEVLDGVYHFDPGNQDRDWIRVRSRVGLRADHEAHRFELRLCNEHRHFLDPDDVDFDRDEVIIDRLLWAWRLDEAVTLTVGRQDIIWPGGFLMLEGHPLDGSRSIYHNAVRLEVDQPFGHIDVAFISNPATDSIVLDNDLERRLCDMDEKAIALQWRRRELNWSMIWKDEEDPDGVVRPVRSLTCALGVDAVPWPGTTLRGEFAMQYHDDVGDFHFGDDFAEAFWVEFSKELCPRSRVEAGFFYYGGDDRGTRAFRTPWGHWPKWSELYIYSLIGEGGDGRVHVAAWQNIAAPHATLHRRLSARVDASLGLSWLRAPEPDWTCRGLLTKAAVRFDLGKGFDGHLLWERFAPSSFHDGSGGLPPLTDTVHFLRWQISWTL